jgi:16S rRNA (adenine1518-N6/adenine1519-N6)-dimethyltransferase
MVRAKKRFGQNFLKDEYIVRQIVEAIPENGYQLVEIGAGLGDLTQDLLKYYNVVAFEIDKELCGKLKKRFATYLSENRLQLICNDVLAEWKSGVLLDRLYMIVANLPYYISTKIVIKALEDAYCRDIIVMVQKEVGEKFLAVPGNREFSALSVLAQSLGRVNRVVDVPPSSFVPPPKVDSLVIHIAKERDMKDFGKFRNFLNIAFQQPRKKLFSNLSKKYKQELIYDAFAKLSLDISSRPHEVQTSQYQQIYYILEGLEIGREKQQKQQTKSESN